MAKAENLVRTKTVGVRLTPKLHYLAELAAQYQGTTLSGFIESAIKRALTVEAMNEDEPNVNVLEQIQPKPLWNEGLYAEDEADRFFLLAVAKGPMSPEQLTLWKLLSEKLTRKNGKFNRQQFRELWDEFVGGIRRDAGIDE